MFHLVDTHLSLFVEVEHWFRIDLKLILLFLCTVSSDQTAPSLLICYSGFVRLVNILLVEVGKLRYVVSYKIALWIPFLRKGNGTVAPVELTEKR